MIQLSSFCIDLFDLTFSQLPTDSVDLDGWVLKDISEGYPSFVFPSYILQLGKGVRVYTNEVYPEYGGSTFGCGKAI